MKKHNSFKVWIWIAIVAGMSAFACAEWANAGEGAVDALFPVPAEKQVAEVDAEKLLNDLQRVESVLNALEEQVKRLEARLGPASRRPPTLSTSIERRMEDIERRLDRIEQQLGQMRNMEQRVRRLEAQRR